MKIIDGKTLAESYQVKMKEEVRSFPRKPGLAVILVGEDPASSVYVRNKIRACANIGLHSIHLERPADISEENLLADIYKLNSDDEIDGILVQLPLPDHIRKDAILEAIDTSKDVDGFSAENMGRLAQKRPLLRPCTPHGVMQMIDSIGYEVRGKNCVIVGSSNIVGRPMALELLNRGGTITICHSKTIDTPRKTREADLLVVAVGRPLMIKEDWVKPGALVIDVGINRENGKLVGDVDYDAVVKKASFITPVPGGVGPMTISALLENTLVAYKAREGLK